MRLYSVIFMADGEQYKLDKVFHDKDSARNYFSALLENPSFVCCEDMSCDKYVYLNLMRVSRICNVSIKD